MALRAVYRYVGKFSVVDESQLTLEPHLWGMSPEIECQRGLHLYRGAHDGSHLRPQGEVCPPEGRGNASSDKQHRQSGQTLGFTCLIFR